MNKDGCYTFVHMHQARNADLFDDVCKDRLPSDDIFVLPQHQPINPEDEDDVVPDQHAAFGIQRATQATREPAWKDLGLAALMRRGPNSGGFQGAPPGGGLGTGVGSATANTYAYYRHYYGYQGDTLARSRGNTSGASAATAAATTTTATEEAGTTGGGHGSSARDSRAATGGRRMPR